MPRRPRANTGGIVQHVLNRAAGRATLFEKPADYAAFERVLEKTQRRVRIRILSYCLLPNHWHFALWPEDDGHLSEFMRLLTVTHTQRRHAYRQTAGTGPIYQGRFKSFPVETGEPLMAVLRYVERNALRAGLVKRAEEWRWSSLWRRVHGSPEERSLLSDWPIEPPPDWVAWVNEPLTEGELRALRTSVERGRPFGTHDWAIRAAETMGLLHTLHEAGRPRRVM